MKFAGILLCASLPVGMMLSGLDVKNFGAVGDGVTDDSAALRKAVERLKADGGGRLDFPTGVYRIGTRHGGLVFNGVSNLKISFAHDAMLLMDNLEANGNGGGHGMTFRAPAENIELLNVNIVWKNKPKRRSMGDGLRFEGFPENGRTLHNIRLENCRVEASAQTGAVLMGCSNVTVKNFTVKNSWADGLHFNACRNVTVDGVNGEMTGDDTLAFVTYYAPKFSGKTGTVFSLPGLGEWNNSDSSAINIHASGGRANGIRIAGAKNLKISNVEVKGKSSGTIVDAGTVGPRHKWQYLASRGIEIRNGKLQNCDTGLYIWQFNAGLDKDKFSAFDIMCEHFTISGCRNDSVHLSGASGIRLKDFRTDGCRWRFRTFRDCVVEQAAIAGAPFLLIGNDAPVKPEETVKLTTNCSRLNEIALSSGILEIQKCRGIDLQNVSISGTPAGAVFVRQTFDSIFRQFKLTGINRDNKSGAIAIRLLQSRKLNWDNVEISTKHPLAASFEIGGGNAQLRCGDISVKNLSSVPESIPAVRFQKGPSAPENCTISTLSGKQIKIK